MKRKARIARIERRIAALERLIDGRDWSTMPPANTIPLVDLPAMPDYTYPWAEYEADGWNPTGYA